MQDNSSKPHSLVCEARARISLTGVEDVDCFSEEMALVTTTAGSVTLVGGGLRVARLDLQAGEVDVEGRIDAIEYGAPKKSGFWGRLFR